MCRLDNCGKTEPSAEHARVVSVVSSSASCSWSAGWCRRRCLSAALVLEGKSSRKTLRSSRALMSVAEVFALAGRSLVSLCYLVSIQAKGNRDRRDCDRLKTSTQFISIGTRSKIRIRTNYQGFVPRSRIDHSPNAPSPWCLVQSSISPSICNR